MNNNELQIGDRVEILDCIYETKALCKGNFGYIVEIVRPEDDNIYMVKLDSSNEDDETWAYLETELEAV